MIVLGHKQLLVQKVAKITLIAKLNIMDTVCYKENELLFLSDLDSEQIDNGTQACSLQFANKTINAKIPDNAPSYMRPMSEATRPTTMSLFSSQLQAVQTGVGFLKQLDIPHETPQSRAPR